MNMKKTLIIASHLIIMTLAYTSPFWLDWRLIIVGLGLYYLQIWIFGGCILTYAQFGKWDETFTGRGIMWFASKVGFRFKNESIKRFFGYLAGNLSNNRDCLSSSALSTDIS